jgi:hypothetical protein
MPMSESTGADSDPLMSLAALSAEASTVSLSSFQPLVAQGDSRIIPSDITIDGVDSGGALNLIGLDEVDFKATNNVSDSLALASPDPPSQINYK